MTLLKFCSTCMRLAPWDYDVTPDPGCYACKGTGYVKPNSLERRVYWKAVNREAQGRTKYSKK